MTVYRIEPAGTAGTVRVPSSKSMGHRLAIAAALTGPDCRVEGMTNSKDMEATARCLAELERYDRDGKASAEHALRGAEMSGEELSAAGRDYLLDCGESGSTLRFLIPVAMLQDGRKTFTGQGKLVSRPLDPYYRIFEKQGIRYTTEKGGLPLTVEGTLAPGAYELPGDVSSQFISGLLFALPLLEGDSVLEVTSPLESASYVGLTLAVLRQAGIRIETEDLLKYRIPGNQRYRLPERTVVEGDWSQAAFWLVAGCLSGDIACTGLDPESLQGDKAVLEILERMGGAVRWEKNHGNGAAAGAADAGDGDADSRPVCRASRSSMKATVIDAVDCPDLVPVLAVAASVAEGTTEIVNAGRLRIKECDRLAAVTSELRKLGARITEHPEGLTIEGRPEGLEGGCEVDAWNDHRIAMSLAVAVTVCGKPIVLSGAESVAKSYPGFWEDYRSLGGRLEEA